MDKSAHDFNEQPERVGTKYEKPKPRAGELEVLLSKFFIDSTFKENSFLQNSQNSY